MLTDNAFAERMNGAYIGAVEHKKLFPEAGTFRLTGGITQFLCYSLLHFTGGCIGKRQNEDIVNLRT
jgi:hypothetical protein